MKKRTPKFDIINSYLALLKNLSPERKRELISRLTDSLKKTKASTKSVGDLYGAFISAKSADEIIADLRGRMEFK